jgi:hypothetical protein
MFGRKDMDPDVTLMRLRVAISNWTKAQRDDSTEVADKAACDAIHAMVALDSWLSSGGFLPAAWQAKRNGIPGLH